MTNTEATRDNKPLDDEAAQLVARPRGYLRDREDEDAARVSFVELFFDLVFVFGITQLAAYLADNITPEGIVRVSVMFVAVWWLWINTAWATNRLDPDRSLVRLAIFALIGGGLVFSTGIPVAFEEQAMTFAAAYVAIQVARSLFMATVDASNRPNVSPKELYAETGSNRLVIADIASGRSARNIRANPAVCVSLIDVFLQRGRKLEGMAEIVAPDHPHFAALAAPLLAKTSGAFPIRHVISVRVERTSAILAPSYVFYPDRGEAEMRADAYRTYGVQPMSE